ncbi:hypothetical protein C8F04DRAFT_1278651 [Mycena alexandri]|uniref:Uncharacterized protein n=1 Tax=Mycena alexandri TaxID=1745969 RepID=A0AAD6WL06_9AGAR|nr:hypothetical protein C8F04DRAFT_1278651 [Mycena alexandri]
MKSEKGEEEGRERYREETAPVDRRQPAPSLQMDAVWLGEGCMGRARNWAHGRALAAASGVLGDSTQMGTASVSASERSATPPVEVSAPCRKDVERGRRGTRAAGQVRGGSAPGADATAAEGEDGEGTKKMEGRMTHVPSIRGRRPQTPSTSSQSSKPPPAPSVPCATTSSPSLTNAPQYHPRAHFRSRQAPGSFRPPSSHTFSISSFSSIPDLRAAAHTAKEKEKKVEQRGCNRADAVDYGRQGEAARDYPSSSSREGGGGGQER